MADISAWVVDTIESCRERDDLINTLRDHDASMREAAAVSREAEAET